MRARIDPRAVAAGGLSLALALLSQGPALAQAAQPQQAPSAQGAQTVGELVVTARKRSETLTSIPESVSALTSAAIAAHGIEDQEDISRQTPNLQLNTRQDLTTDVVIRGVGAYGDVLGVGFTIDDAPNFTDQSLRIEDIDRIEVLKGPQGTLYGGSAIGGEIIYHAKLPQFDWSGEGSIEGGSFSTVNAFLAQNLTLIPDKLALRVSAYTAQNHGWITNKELGVDGNPSRDWGVRAMALWTPTPSFDALLTLRHSYIDNGADEYTAVSSITDFTYDNPLFEPTYNKRSTWGVVLKLDKRFGGYELTSISAYTKAQYAQDVDISFTPPGVPGQILLTLPGNRPTEVASQEIRLTSPTGGRVDWLAGVYGDIIQNILLNQNAVQNYPPPLDTTVVNDFDTRRTDIAAFGTANWHIGKLTLGGGVRLTETKARATIFVEAGGLPNRIGQITSKAILPKVTISYALPNDGIIYANFAEGMEPGNVNAVSTAPIPFQAQRSYSFEVGTKGYAFDRRLEYELAGFYVIDKKHQLETNQFIPAEGGLVTLISNIGDSRTYGIEGSVDFRATRDLTLSGSFGTLSARWTHAAAFGVPIDGNVIPNSPGFTGNLGADYVHSIGRNLQLKLDAETQYTSGFWWDLPNTPGYEEPAYWMGSARAAIGPESGRWELSFRVANLFDAKYWTEYFPLFFGGASNYPGCPTCVNIGAIGAPRAFYAELRVKW